MAETKKINRMSPKNQEILRRLVERDVIYCVSTLVYELTKIDDIRDDIQDILDKPDYESAIENCDRADVYYDDAMDGYVYKDDDGEISEPYDTYYEACEAAVQDLNLDYDYIEAYEHWIVSEFLAEKLKAHGEMVVDVCGLPVWGRCTTGQAIYIDWIIGEIAEEMEILEGQKWDWSER